MGETPAHTARVRQLHEWARALPRRVGRVVADADFTAPHVHLEVPSRPAEVAGVRGALRQWAGELGLTKGQTADVLLAVDEAVSNAVEHAYPDGDGPVTVVAARDCHTPAVHVVVSDEGTWRPPPQDPGSRGRGLAILRKVTDGFDLHHGERGTTVVLDWNLA